MKTVVLMLLLVILGSCEMAGPTVDQKAAQKTEAAMQQASSEVGMPAIKNFTELRLARSIYELRDEAKLETWTYTTDMNGRRHLLCKSVGYGLPYATQYSNPERAMNPYSGVYYNIPQAEPNGLFMPNQADATWVICVAPKGEPKPVYVEDRVIVSPFALNDWESPSP